MERTINIESISLSKLAAIQQSEGGNVYRKIISQIFSGRNNLFAKNRLYSRWPLKLENEAKMNAETIHATQLVHKGECIKKEIQENLFAEKKIEYNEKYIAYLGAEKEFLEIKHEIDDIKKQIEKHSNSVEQLSNELSALEQISREIKRVVLVHNSATLNQLKKYQHRKMVILKSDILYLKPIGVYDEVFTEECDIIELPYDMANRILTPEEQSAVDFVNMMFFFKINDEVEFDAIYSDEVISKLLKFNKYEELS